VRITFHTRTAKELESDSAEDTSTEELTPQQRKQQAVARVPRLRLDKIPPRPVHNDDNHDMNTCQGGIHIEAYLVTDLPCITSRFPYRRPSLQRFSDALIAQ